MALLRTREGPVPFQILPTSIPAVAPGQNQGCSSAAVPAHIHERFAAMTLIGACISAAAAAHLHAPAP